MLASASGPFGALLMILPLAAIPVFAVVGLPQFTPVAASPADEEEISDISERAPATSPTARPASRRSADDLFAPLDGFSASRSHENRKPPDTPATRESSVPRGSRSFRGDDTSVLPPEALDDWEVAINRRSSSNGRGSRQSQPGRIDDPPELPPDGAYPSDSQLNNEPAPVSPDDRGAVSARKKLHDRNQAVPATGSRRARDFNPGLIDPAATPSSEVAPKNPKRDAHPSTVGNHKPGTQSRAGMPEQLAKNESPPSLAGAPEQSGWRTAARRLKELGIRKYRLESQIEVQQFLFRCEYPTPETSNVTELFEAVADTPLDAVLEALQQIDEWLAREDRTAGIIGE
jgi:hypothetical protein